MDKYFQVLHLSWRTALTLSGLALLKNKEQLLFGTYPFIHLFLISLNNPILLPSFFSSTHDPQLLRNPKDSSDFLFALLQWREKKKSCCNVVSIWKQEHSCLCTHLWLLTKWEDWSEEWMCVCVIICSLARSHQPILAHSMPTLFIPI